MKIMIETTHKAVVRRKCLLHVVLGSPCVSCVSAVIGQCSWSISAGSASMDSAMDENIWKKIASVLNKYRPLFLVIIPCTIQLFT